MVKMSHRTAFAALSKDATGVITNPTPYDIPLGTSNTFIQHIGTISRTAVKFDTGNTSIGSKPVGITFRWRKVGTPTGNIIVVIRKASDDTIAATLAQWPVDDTRPATDVRTAVVQGTNTTYSVVANDKISIEYTGTATAGIEIAMNPQQANPVSLFTTQQYTGTYASSANALAATIKTRVLT
jgi:CCR4-NOT transcriptional regulation complex NOT5 subunit